MYSAMFPHFMTFSDFRDSGVGRGLLFSWQECLLFVDVRLILLRHNTAGIILLSELGHAGCLQACH